MPTSQEVACAAARRAQPFDAGDPDGRLVNCVAGPEWTPYLILTIHGRQAADTLRGQLLGARDHIDGFEGPQALWARNVVTVCAAALAAIRVSGIPDGEVTASVAALLDDAASRFAVIDRTRRS